jgi:superfamily I DNA/RNA helicase
MRYLSPLIFWCLLLLVACQPSDPAQSAVDEAIAYHGGNAYDTFRMEFDFRDKHYVVERQQGTFRYERHQSDSTGAALLDVYTNDSTYRSLNGQRQNLPDTTLAKYQNSVNSVAYFVLLPQPLNDAAVRKEYLGEATIKGKTYHKVLVTFAPESGGKDFSDEFVYWFDTTDHSLDYLAYLYHTDDTGLRFREAYNPLRVEGILVQDYVNYAPAEPAMAVTRENLVKLDQLFEAGQLKELSRIENKNVKVSSR